MQSRAIYQEPKSRAAVERAQPPRVLSTNVVASLPGAQKNALRLDVAGVTDRGLQRPQNEDTFLIARIGRVLDVLDSSYTELPSAWRSGREQGHLLIVADGMGGHPDGAIASAVSIAAVANYLSYIVPWISSGERDSLPRFREHLAAAIAAGEEGIRRAVNASLASPDMGTTLTLALVIGSHAYVAHVGDSRLYLSRAHQLYQMTRDHTLTAELERHGAAGSSMPGMEHVLTNAVRGNCPATPDLFEFDIDAGDQLLLCSDGLFRHVADEHIAEVLSSGANAGACCSQLVDRALAGGGSDNVSVIVARTLS